MNQWSRWDESAAPAESAWRWLAEALAMPALLATPPRPLAEMVLPAPRLAEGAREKFMALLGADRVRQSDEERVRHAGGRAAPDRLRLRTGDLSHAPDAVLYPRSQDDVLALLRLCLENNIAVVPFGAGRGTGTTPACGTHAGIVSCDLSAMAHLLSVDVMSGTAEAEAGITGVELNRHLAMHGMMLDGPQDATLGGFIAQTRQEISWLETCKLATPQGLVEYTSPHLVAGSQGRLGIITSVSLRIRAIPAQSDQRRYLFADFAGGLAALREAQRQGVAGRAALCDAAETRFHDQMAQMGRQPDWRDRLDALYRHLRHFDSRAAALVIRFDGSDANRARKRFEAIARRLGAVALRQRPSPAPGWDESLLDRGVAVERFETRASWAKLPALYAGLRATLDQAVRAHAPRAGAHGLVLGKVGDIRHEGASLTLTCIYPRALGNDVIQAEAIRQAGLEAIAARTGTAQGLDAELARAIRQTLDPKGILNPDGI
jgi:alkyldihydroxyacetonephosphate synthase